MRRSRLASAATGALVAGAALRLSARLPGPARSRWERPNHAGDAVTLLEGPALVAGLLAGAVGSPPTGRAALAVAAAASGALGALDDLVGDAASKGLRGHLAAVRRGQVTTGAVKVVGLAATGLAAAALADRGRRSVASTLVGGAVVAASANAVNLFDLRPGRALKVVVVAALPLAAAPGADRCRAPGAAAAAAVVGAGLGVVGEDLAGRAMLGDTGANAAGAALGLALVERTGLAGRLVALGVLTGLTLASERVSFTQVIAAHPLLRRLDEWGRPRR